MSTMQPNDFNTLSYRLDGVEKQLSNLQGQLQQYVPQRENELRLQSIQGSVMDIKGDVAEIRKQINDMSQKMIDQEAAAQKRDNAQRETIDKKQIRDLRYFVTSVIGVFLTVLAALIIYYVTNFHP